MNLSWRQKLPTGEALQAEAARLGLHFEAGDKTNDAELQQRLLVAWAERRNAIVNYTQTIAIIGTLLITLALAVWNEHRESNQESADLMIKFSEMLASGKSGIVAEALDLDGNLERAKNVDDEAINEFLGNYDLLAAAYRHGLIDKDMANDAFSYDLERALQDRQIRAFLGKSRAEESDVYEGVFELARSWKIAFPPLPSVQRPASETPQSMAVPAR